MKEVTTKQKTELGIMLEGIRNNHIDIIPILQEEISNILPQFIEEIVKGVYENMEAK